MKALGIKDQFVAAILDGRKPFTLRRAWKNGKTPDLGERLSLATGHRTAARRVLATCIVGFRATVLIGPTTVAGIEADRMLATWRDSASRVFRAARAASDAEFADMFARLDGFDSFATFRSFHARHRAGGSDPIAQRELIGLVAVTEAFTDA